MIVTETRLIQEMTDFLAECDRDELVRIAEEMFGGKWSGDAFGKDGEWLPNSYTLEPNELYGGAFGEPSK